jgi:hypothetical protein
MTLEVCNFGAPLLQNSNLLLEDLKLLSEI